MIKIHSKLTHPKKSNLFKTTTHTDKVSTCCTYAQKLPMKTKPQKKKIRHTNTSPNKKKLASNQTPPTCLKVRSYSKSTN